MNLETIPDTVWTKLSREALQEQPRVANLFYRHIYSKWSEGQVQYNQNLPDEADAGWSSLIKQWTSLEKVSKYFGLSLGDSLGDDTVGRAYVQGKDGPEAEMRLWEKYNSKPGGDRFQFVVDSGGGMVLFNRMRRACQQYIHDKLAGDPEEFIIRGWKVFGEEFGDGRSDSCCVYMAVQYTNPEVNTVVEEYIWPQVKDLVNANFVPLGFYKVCNHPLWAMRMPGEPRERLVLGDYSRGSAGALMSSVFAKAYLEAVAEDHDDVDGLTAVAKEKAAGLVDQLYDD